MFNVHLFYNNVDDKLDVSSTNNKKLKMHDNIRCRYAEIVCNNKESLENNTSVYFGNTDSNFHDNSTIFIDLSIDRDETSPLQPIFTGYFPELSKEDLSSYENDFKDLKTASLKCPILKNDTDKCDKSKSVHIHINTNYIQNNTKTNYPNCTMDTATIHSTFNLICNNVTFAKYNTQLKFTSKPEVKKTPTPISDGKQDPRSWSCEMIGFLTTKGLDNDFSEINFKKCFKDLSNTNTSTAGDKNDVKSTEIDVLKNDNTTDVNLRKLIKIIINENGNCTQNLDFLNLQRGKFIDFGVTKQNVFKNDEIEINLSNCMKVKKFTLNDTDKLPHKNLEIIISSKNKSLNAFELKLLNRSTNQKGETERIFLGCDHSNNPNNKTNQNITVLQCESIDAKDLIVPENTTRDHRSWNCQIPKVKDSLITKRRNNHINEIDFNNCLKDSSLSSNEIANNKEKNKLISSKPHFLEKVNTTDKNSKKLIKIIMNENTNCTKIPSLKLQHGKFFDFGVKSYERNVLENDVVEINLSNCLKANYSTMNDTNKLTQEKDNIVDMTIFLKNESLNAADLKLLNGAPKEINESEKLILRCDRSNNSNNKTSTELQCETIDLKDLKMLENNIDINQDITQDDQGWNCQIIEFNSSLSSTGKIKKTYFKDCFKSNSKEKNELTSSKPDLVNKYNITDINPKKLIKIIMRENINCTQNIALNIQHGKLVDFGVTKSNVLENDIVEINLSNCIKSKQSTINSTDKLLTTEMTIFLKNESLNASDLKLLNNVPKQERKETDGNDRLFLRCDSSNVPNSKTTNRNKALECETIELKDLIKLENSRDINQNITKDTSIDNNNNDKNEKKNVEGNKTFTKNIGEKDKRDIQNLITFNRKKDVNKLGKAENLNVEDVDVEKIILITLAAIAGTSTLLLLALRFCKKPGHHYNPAATREPAVDEETAF
ncbi:reticulocyte-binding protein 2 homolog a-like isoform X2 [Spodoptera litura]|nr:reticulocyte-binding protein 2 homolog a-like isoform X2 [Spodoptera litura]